MRILTTGLACAGLLAATGAALAQPEERGTGRKIAATLTGAAEVPGPGDTNGAGLFEARVNPGTGRICYTLSAANIDTATAAHIHLGAATASGGVVLTLQTPDGQDDDSEECQDIDKTLAQQLIQNPQNYYVNVHTGPFPNGAVRGQLKT
jgi:hypothetical protein